MWIMSAWGMTGANRETPILFQRVNRPPRHLTALRSVVDWNTLDLSHRKRCYNGFQLCTFSMSESFPSCVCMHCVHACVCRGQRGTKSFRTELWTPVSPVHGGCFCKGSKCSFTTNMSLPLLGHVKLHIWLVLFFCNRIALEAADPTMQVSSFHIFCILQYSR